MVVLLKSDPIVRRNVLASEGSLIFVTAIIDNV